VICTNTIEVYTLILPHTTPTRTSFLQLFKCSGGRNGENTINVGFCFLKGNAIRHEELGLPPYYLGKYSSTEVQPGGPIEPEELIVSLLYHAGQGYISSVDEHSKISGDFQASLTPGALLDPPDAYHLDSLYRGLSGLRETLKSVSKGWESLRKCRERIKDLLYGRERIRERETRADSKGPDNPNDKNLLVRDIIRFINGLERAQDIALSDVRRLEDDIREMMQTVGRKRGLIEVSCYAKSYQIQVSGVKQDMKDQRDKEMQQVLVNLTAALSRDSANMKIIAILTAFFLPFTFMAVRQTLRSLNFW
jgi:hypothetical protein